MTADDAVDGARYEVTGDVELFPQPGGWHHVTVPTWMSDGLSWMADRGLVAIRASLGVTSWDTSLLPTGDGRHFIALNAKVRKANDVAVGDRVTIRFTPRDRR